MLKNRIAKMEKMMPQQEKSKPRSTPLTAQEFKEVEILLFRRKRRRKLEEQKRDSIEKLEKIKRPCKESNGLDKLSVPELDELQVYAIKRSNGESPRDAEIERFNAIMAKIK